MTFKFGLVALMFVTLINVVNAQDRTDSISKPSIDTARYVIENRIKHKVWGNSTYISAASNFARNNEFDLSIGRTTGKAFYATRGLGDYTIKTVGIGYSITDVRHTNVQSIKAFYEFNYYPFIIIGNLALRGEYLYCINNQQNYLRPAIGWTFVFLDVTYNYSFLLNGSSSQNIFRHGLCLRLKAFVKRKNWQRQHSIIRY
jgi:hypothetical protein